MDIFIMRQRVVLVMMAAVMAFAMAATAPAPTPSPTTAVGVVPTKSLKTLKQKPWAMSNDSDLAKVFYDRYKADVEMDSSLVIFPTEPPSEITKFLTSAGLTWSELKPHAKAAVLWDFGYVLSSSSSYAKIYVKCSGSNTMEDIAVSIDEYTRLNSTDYDAQDCQTSVRQHNLMGVQLYPVVKCASEDIQNEMHSCMWVSVDTSAKSMPMPFPTMGRHAWNEEKKWLILAIHAAGEDVAWEQCPAGDSTYGLVIPCVKYEEKDPQWCRPKRGTTLTKWVKELSGKSPKSGSTEDSSNKSGSSSSSTSTIIGIVIGVAVTLAAVGGVVFWKRHKNKAKQEQRHFSAVQSPGVTVDKANRGAQAPYQQHATPGYELD